MKHDNKQYDAVALGIRIKELRNAMHLSQASFSERLCVNREYIAKIEGGKKSPSIDLLIEIADMTSVSLDYLILGHKESSDFKKKHQSISNGLTHILSEI